MAYNLIGKIRPTFKGTWKSATAYDILDIVTSADGYIAYSAISSVPSGIALGNTSYWTKLIDMSPVSSAVTDLNNTAVAINASLSKKIDGAYINTSGELCLTANGTLASGPFAIVGGGDGGYYIPSVSSNGNLSWTASSSGMPVITTVNIKGPKGDSGADGTDGAQGPKGEKGDSGTSVTHSWNGTTLYVTSASGTSSANLKGEKGDTGDRGPQGEKGADGTVSFDNLTNEQKESLRGEVGEKGEKGDTGPQGPQGEKGEKGADGTMSFEDLTEEQRESLKGEKGDDGYTPVKGVDYFTEADKAEIIQSVIAELPTAEGVSY